MKHLYTFLCVLFTTFASCAAQSGSAPQAALLSELNLARTAPGEYAAILEDYLLLHEGRIRPLPGMRTLSTREGTSAIREAIAFLRKQPALRPLAFSASLSLVTDAYLREQASTGRLGHISADGSTFDARMSALGTWTLSCSEAKPQRNHPECIHGSSER